MCWGELFSLPLAVMAHLQEDIKDGPCVHQHVMGAGEFGFLLMELPARFRIFW